MKYIRTEDGIYEYEKVKTRVFAQEGMHSKEKLLSEEESLRLFPYEIVKYADSIEELCDDFVSVSKYGYTKPVGDIVSWNYVKTKAKYDAEYVYGAIWTEHGLKYVAKMDERGELELL